MLEGYKTYIVAALLVITGVLYHFGIIDLKLFAEIGTLLGAGAIATTRSAIAGVASKVK